MTLSKFLLASLMLPVLVFAADPSPVVPLWPNGAPGSEARKNEPEMVNAQGRVYNIHNPSVTVYLPPKDKATGAAVVIIPGGGDRYLSIDHEGYAVAKWLSEHGVAGFVLKHRLARETNSTYQVEVQSLQDTQRAIRTVRSRAQEWSVDPARVGVMGFSAGGELAALASLRFDNGIEGATDPVDRQNSKPSFQALIYPGGSQNLAVTSNSPPAFLACAYNDNLSVALANAYLNFKKAGVNAELHIYSTGGHGFGLRPSNPPTVGSWPERFQEWMTQSGFLKKP